MSHFIYKQLLLKHIKTINSLFPLEKIQIINNELLVVVHKSYLLDLLLFFKLNVNCQYKVLTLITASDYPLKKKRFEVIYELLSLNYNQRLRIKVYLHELESLPSCETVFPAANWYEREVWDLFGIFFSNHSDLRRILTDYGFEGYPLRKDFPLTGYTEVRYSDTLKRVVNENLELAQEYRTFDFLSPWSASRSELNNFQKYTVLNK